METTEKVVESYVRYVKGWATIPNIKCRGQYEIDLLAIDPKNNEKYHIESGVSVPGPFSKLTSKPYNKDLIKIRLHQAAQRRTLGYFVERKFATPVIVESLESYGFEAGSYLSALKIIQHRNIGIIFTSHRLSSQEAGPTSYLRQFDLETLQALGW